MPLPGYHGLRGIAARWFGGVPRPRVRWGVPGRGCQRGGRVVTVPARVLAQAQALAHGASGEKVVRTELVEHLLSRPNGLWTLQRLAALSGLQPGRIDAELAAVLVDQARGQLGRLSSQLGRNVVRRHVHGWSCGP